MHGVVVLAIFGFCLVLAHAIAARRPLVAVLAVVAGAGWAATLYPSRERPLRRVDPRRRPLGARRPAFDASDPGTPRRCRAHSRRGGGIDLGCGREGRRPRLGAAGIRARSAGAPISVSYVWDAQYGGIQFSKKERTVLRITGPKRGLYWRATTLDQFDSDRWLDNPIPLSTGLATGRLPNDPLLPTRSLEPEHLGEAGGGDRRASRSAHHRRGAAGLRSMRLSWVASSTSPAGSCASTAASSAGRSTPSTATRRAPSRPISRGSPPSIRQGSSGSSTSAGRGSSRSAPSRSRCARARRSSTTSATSRCGRTRSSGTKPSGCARARGRRTEPSSRSRRGCGAPAASPTTSPRPPTGGLPPLAHFVTEGKRGYCQHFAGAMALMLRFLGIPARVAGGFTSGKREGTAGS